MKDPIDTDLARLDRDWIKWDALVSFAEEHDLSIEEAELEILRRLEEAIVELRHAGDMWP